ncbi:MAG: ABC transporter substrate-binding protein [Devosia sp.]
MSTSNIYSSGVSRRAVVAGLLGSVALSSLGGIGAARAAGDKVRIGLSHAYTGWAAAFDVAFAVGYQFAVDEVNAKGGVSGKYMIDLIKGTDTASSSVEAIKSADGLLDQGIDILYLSCDATSAVAAGLAGQQKNVLMFPSTSTQPDVTTQVGDWMYLANFSDNLSGGSSGIYAAKDLGAKTAYLLKSSDNTYTENVPEYFRTAFEKSGGTVLGQANYVYGQVDFGGIIADIKKLPSEPDVISTAAFEPDLPAFLHQIRAAGIKSRIVGADAIDTPSFMALGDLVEGTIVISNRQLQAGSKYEEVATLHPEHVENSAWIVGYEAALIVFEAVRLADATDAASIRAAVDKIVNLEVPTGTITFTGFDRRPVVPINFLEVQGGKGVFKKAAIIDPADIPAPIV